LTSLFLTLCRKEKQFVATQLYWITIRPIDKKIMLAELPSRTFCFVRLATDSFDLCGRARAGAVTLKHFYMSETYSNHIEML
jgi:hypothetical protein